MPAQTTNGDYSANAPTKAHALRGYEDSRSELRELLAKRERLRLEVAEIGETLERQETEYIDNNPTGNIIQGWDGLLKGGSSAEAKRRRNMMLDSFKIFSRSHISYNPDATLSTPASATSTPAGSLAQTPHSASFARGESVSGTPISAGPAGSTVGPTGANKNKRAKKHEEDSETDHRVTKKARGNGSSRK